LTRIFNLSTLSDTEVRKLENSMPSGWDVYYVVFLSALFALGIPAALSLVSRSLAARGAPRTAARAQDSPEAPAASSVGRKLNTRFFLGANASLLLITLALVLIPCISGLQARPDGAQSAAGLRWVVASVVSLAVFASLGLFYASRKGDLDWLRSFRGEVEAPGGARK
jgi:NADH:ubiquinone oxidoreductase subunit 3 (subunit A)